MEREMPPPIDLIGLINKFLKFLFKYWILALVLAIIFAAAGYLRAEKSFVPMYESKARFSVSSGFNSNDIFSGSYYYDNTAAEQLAESFPHLLKTDMMRELIMQQIGKGYINGSITAESVANTNMMVLSVNSSSPEDAYNILCAVIDYYPQVAVYTVDNPQVVIKQSPEVPQQPYNSFSGSSALMRGGAIGLILGLSVILIISLISSTVDSPDEFKKAINLPIFATFPLVVRKKRRKQTQTGFISGLAEPSISEALRGLRVRVKKLFPENRMGNVIAVTSSLPGEGKTTVAANLALSLSEDGHKTLLVDADFRHQSVLEIFGDNEKKIGLMELLENSELNAFDSLRGMPHSSLKFISGESTDKRHYRIDTRAMKRILIKLGKEFEYIIVDTPPCGVVSDTPLLCRCADNVLFVVKQSYAKRSQIIDIVTTLFDKGVRVTGCIFNCSTAISKRHGYGYKYGYGYGYGKNRHSKYPRRKAEDETE